MKKKKGFLETACLSILWLLVLAISSVNAKVPDSVLKQKEAVVTIYIYENDELIAYGSGFIINPDGIIATNYHVVSLLFKNPDTAIAIKMENGEFIKAQKMLSLDETNDVALIKVESKGLPSLKLSQDYRPNSGEDVFVIGSPFGFETTLSNGIISSIRGTDEFLQITAPISPGSSGSPVFNTNGEVIGIATLIMESGQNLNFAIPIKYITNIKKSEITKEETLKATIPSPVALPKAESKEKSFEEYIKLAKEHFKNERWNEAIEEYTKAISIRPEDANLYLARGKTYLIMPEPAPAPEEPIPSSEAPAYNKAIEDYSKAIALQPDNVIFYVARADVYYFKEEYENAIKDLDKAIALKPDISFLYYDRGIAYHKIKQYRRAIDDFTKAINLKPDKQKYLSIKLSPYIEYLDVFDANWYLSCFYVSRAQSYQESLQINEAIKDYEKCVTIIPLLCTFSLSILYEQEGKLEEAIKFYSYAITLHPKSDTLYKARAHIYIKLKQHDKALKDYTKAIALDPKNSFNYSDRGDLYKELKQYNKAIGDYSRAIALEPKNSFYSLRGGLYYNRGELYVKANQKQKALHDFQRACDLNTVDCWRLTEYQKEIARGEKWMKFSQRENESLYYDKTSIRQQPNKHIRVWVRTEVEDISAYIEARKKNYQKTEGYENYSHGLDLWEFNCNSANVGIISVLDYDDKGKVLDSYNIDKKSINLEPVVPDSSGDALYKIVCKGKGKKD